MTSAESIKYRSIPKQNIVLRLFNRETFGSKSNASRFHVTRQFYQNVLPNYTVINIEKPPCFLRKFTPDGKYLIAFSQDQTSVEIYEYQGPACSETLLKDLPTGDYTEDTANNEDLLNGIRSRIFDTFFRKLHVINVTSHGEQLNRECSLFTDDSKFVIVGSAAYVSEESHPHYFDVYQNNESVALSSRSPLEDYSLHLIDIAQGRLCDKRTFKTGNVISSCLALDS